MRLNLPPKELLVKTGDVDYYDWNYKFPIKYVQQYRFKRILKRLRIFNVNTLLEVGTGSGIFLPELSKNCKHLYACDIHEHFESARNICAYYNINHVHFSTQSIEKTNYESNTFDVIIAVSVLEFVNDIHTALQVIKRILKKNGVLITICPMENKLLDTVVSFYSRLKASDEFGESRKNVGSTLEKNFEIIKKGSMLPILGKWWPVYTDYVLRNTK